MLVLVDDALRRLAITPSCHILRRTTFLFSHIHTH